jgi:hypothetical protein
MSTPTPVLMADARALDGIDLLAALEKAQRTGFELPAADYEALRAIPLDATHLAVPTKFVNTDTHGQRRRLVCVFANMDLDEIELPGAAVPYLRGIKPLARYHHAGIFIPDEDWRAWRGLVADAKLHERANVLVGKALERILDMGAVEPPLIDG